MKLPKSAFVGAGAGMHKHCQPGFGFRAYGSKDGGRKCSLQDCALSTMASTVWARARRQGFISFVESRISAGLVFTMSLGSTV